MDAWPINEQKRCFALERKEKKLKRKPIRLPFCFVQLCFKAQAYDFFIGRFELQYPHEADCAPVHLTSVVRIGAPQCGQVPGNKSVRWMGSTGGAGGDIGIGIGMGSTGGGGGFCGHCGVADLKSPSKMMLRPIRIRMPGHQCPQKNRMASPINQKALRKDLHGW
jgi:hypothetical protein